MRSILDYAIADLHFWLIQRIHCKDFVVANVNDIRLEKKVQNNVVQTLIIAKNIISVHISVELQIIQDFLATTNQSSGAANCFVTKFSL